MFTLFDLLEDNKENGSNVEVLSINQESLDERESYLNHLKKVSVELYNEDDIKKSGLSRADYIRTTSYVGSRINTDFRNVNKPKGERNKLKDIETKNDFKGSDKESRDRLLIVDGSSLLSTSFYATARELLFAKTDEQKEEAYTKLMQTKDGVYTNGFYMFFKTLLPLLKENKITHLAIVLDRSRSTTFRREIDPEYKANRKDTPAPLKSQFKLLTEMLPKMNIPVFSHEYYEADDFAGSIAKRFENDIEVILHSKDEDYIQLVTDKSKLWMVTSKSDDMYKEIGVNRKDIGVPYGVFEYNPEYVKHFKGIEPIQIIDAKAIEGDKSDNIKGVKNVGETSSRPLLRHYGDLEGIYNAIEGLDAKSEKELNKFFKEELGIKRSPIKNMLLYKDDAFLSKKLATIKTDIEEISELKLGDLKLNIDVNSMNEIFKNLEIKSLIQ